MSEYIKREDMMDILWKHAEEMSDILCNELTHNIPSADVVERKRGEWIEYGIDHILSEEGDYENIATMYACSECDSDYSEKSNFCPHCGADMREREGE